MKKRKFKLKHFYILMSSIFGGIGILFLAVSIGTIIFNSYVEDNYYLTKALVVEIKEYDDTGDIFVSYYYNENGHTFQNNHENINYYTTMIDEGDIIDIYINPKDGEIVYLDNLLVFIFGGLSLVFITIGTVFLVILIKAKIKRSKFLKSGIKIYARVIGYEKMKLVTFQDEHPYKIRCEYEDIFGKKFYFISDPVILDEQDFTGSKYLAVYLLNKKDFSNYYIDTEDVKKESQLTIY